MIHDEDAARTCGEPAAGDRGAAGAGSGPSTPGAGRGRPSRGERIPLLAEVLEALPGAVVNVELKARRGRPDRGAGRRGGPGGGRGAGRAARHRLLLRAGAPPRPPARRAPGWPPASSSRPGWAWRAWVPAGGGAAAPLGAPPGPAALHAGAAGGAGRRPGGRSTSGRWTTPAEAARLAAGGAAASSSQRARRGARRRCGGRAERPLELEAEPEGRRRRGEGTLCFG